MLSYSYRIRNELIYLICLKEPVNRLISTVNRFMDRDSSLVYNMRRLARSPCGGGRKGGEGGGEDGEGGGEGGEGGEGGAEGGA